jgi:hypothetical protein
MVFEVWEVADENPREEMEAMARWRCPKPPGMAVRNDRSSVAARAWSSATVTEGFRKWRSYPEMQEAEAI